MKILLATDGSRYSREALRLLKTLIPSSDPGDATEAFPLELELVAVRQVDRAARLEDRVPAEVAQRWLDAAAQELEGPGRVVTRHLLVGDPAQELAARCEAGGHDVVVAGVKGRGATPFFELGRVALHLVRWAPASVLLVRPTVVSAQGAGVQGATVQGATVQGAGAIHAGEGLRVLLPTDGRPEPLEASWRILEGLAHDRVQVEVVRVVEPSSEPVLASGTGPVDESTTTTTTTTGATRVREGARRWGGAGARRTLPAPALLHGRPAAAIARWAEAHRSELVVLGTQRPDGVRECHLGRTGRELVWSSPCSVLMVRA